MFIWYSWKPGKSIQTQNEYCNATYSIAQHSVDEYKQTNPNRILPNWTQPYHTQQPIYKNKKKRRQRRRRGRGRGRQPKQTAANNKTIKKFDLWHVKMLSFPIFVFVFVCDCSTIFTDVWTFSENGCSARIFGFCLDAKHKHTTNNCKIHEPTETRIHLFMIHKPFLAIILCTRAKKNNQIYRCESKRLKHNGKLPNWRKRLSTSSTRTWKQPQRIHKNIYSRFWFPFSFSFLGKTALCKLCGYCREILIWFVESIRAEINIAYAIWCSPTVKFTNHQNIYSIQRNLNEKKQKWKFF